MRTEMRGVLSVSGDHFGSVVQRRGRGSLPLSAA
jgi:hypothetical protein